MTLRYDSSCILEMPARTAAEANTAAAADAAAW